MPVKAMRPRAGDRYNPCVKMPVSTDRDVTKTARSCTVIGLSTVRVPKPVPALLPPLTVPVRHHQPETCRDRIKLKPAESPALDPIMPPEVAKDRGDG